MSQLQRRPMTALAEAVRYFIQHGEDESAGKSEFDLHLDAFKEDPRQPPPGVQVTPGTRPGWYRPHPLDLHPPNTQDSKQRLERILNGQEKLDGHSFHPDPTTRDNTLIQLDQLAQTLEVDHVYLLYLTRQIQSDEARLWVKSKVQPHAVMEEELSLGGGQAADRGIDFLLNYVECVRYLFFIEKRAGLQALLDLVQAQFSKDITESKLHSISEAVEGFVRQGMPALLMARIKALTDKNLNGRSDLEVELEVERQKAAECLHFLYYQTPIPASLLLPTQGDGTGAASPSTPTLIGLVQAMSKALKESVRAGDGGGGAGARGPLLSLVPPLTTPPSQAGSMMALGGGGRQHEDNVLFKALVTVVMTAVNALILPHEYAPRPGADAMQQEPSRMGFKDWLHAPAHEYAVVSQELSKLKKSGVAAGSPQERDLEARLAKLSAEAKRRVGLVQRHVVLQVPTSNGQTEPADAFQALLALALGAFFSDIKLDKELLKAAQFEAAKTRTELLAGALRKRVFAFIEGALVTTWSGQSAEEVQSFYLDEMVELLGHYLRSDQARSLADPIELTDGMGNRTISLDTVETVVSLVRRLSEMDVGAFSPSSVLGCFSSTSGKDGADLTDSTQSPFFWLATRLLWTRSRDTWVPVAFVNEVFRWMKSELREQLLVTWLELLTAMASSPAAVLKIETVEYLVANSPYATDVFHYVLETAIASAMDTLPFNDRQLQATLVLIERVTCRALANYPHISFVSHILPRLFSLCSCVLGEEAKGLLFRALAAFARLPKHARQIWEHLEDIAMLPVIKRELEMERDASPRRFSISEGYCILLVDLLRGDMPHDLGEAAMSMGGSSAFRQQAGQQVGIQPYIDHLLMDLRQAVMTVQATSPTEQAPHYWKMLAKVLEAMVLILQRYPIADGDEDRMRNLGLDHIQRRVAREESIKDLEIPFEARPPSPGFQLLKRLLVPAAPGGQSLLHFVVSVITQVDAQAGGPPSFSQRYQQQQQQLLIQQGALYGGCLVLERKNRERETKALVEAVQVLDALEEGEDKDLKRSRAAAEELAWREQAVKLALEVLNHVFVKDRPFSEMVKSILGGRAEDEDDDDMSMEIAADPHELPRELSKCLRLTELLPLVIQYSAYDYNAALRLQAALLLREWLQRHPHPAEVRNCLALLPEDQLARTKDSALKNVMSQGSPVEDFALEFGTLSQALNLLTKFEPHAQEVERLVHYLTLDTLLENLKPLMWTVSHVLLGFHPVPTTGSSSEEPRLPLESGVMFTFKTIVTNLTSPSSFVISAPLLAERSMELVFRLCAGKRTTQATLAFLQSSPVDFFHRMLPFLRKKRPPPSQAPRLSLRPDAKSLRLYVEHASLLHLWAWLLKAVAVALHFQQTTARLASSAPPGPYPALTAGGTDYSKPATLFNLLFLNHQRGLPLSGDEPQQAGTLVTDILNNLALARDEKQPAGDRPEYPSREVEALMKEHERTVTQPLTGSSETRRYFVINADHLMTVLRQRLAAVQQQQQQQQEQQQQQNPDGMAGPDERYANDAQNYALHWNHFALRLAGEFHFCQAWRRVVATALLSCRSMVVDEQRPEEERLALVLALLECAVRKTTKFLHADAFALQQLAGVAASACGVMHDFAVARPGIPLSVLDESQAQMTLELLLQGLLRMGGREERQPGSSVDFRTSFYTATRLLLGATTLATLPSTAQGDLIGSSRSSSVGMLVAEPSGEELVSMRRRANAAVLAEERFLPALVAQLVEDCTSGGYLYSTNQQLLPPAGYGKPFPPFQALAAATLGFMFELIRAEKDEVSGRPRFPKALDRFLQQLPRLLKDVEAQFCVLLPGPDTPPPTSFVDESQQYGLADANIVPYFSMLTQLAQEREGASILVNHNIVRILDNARCFRQQQQLSPLMAGAGDDDERATYQPLTVVVRLLETILTALPDPKGLQMDVMELLDHHEAVLTAYVKDFLSRFEGLEAAGVFMSLLAHTVDPDGGRDVAPPYPLLAYHIFETFALDLLPPFAVDFLRGSTQKSWWGKVSMDDRYQVPCEPPPGARDDMPWQVADALKLQASQNLLLRVTTYMRSRLRAGFPYDYLQWERVVEAIRVVLDLLKKQGPGPSPPLPPLGETMRYQQAMMLNQAGLLRSGRKMPWNYDYLRTTLRHLLGHLLYILYHVIVLQEKRRPRFQMVKQDIRQRFQTVISGYEDMLDGLEMGGGGAASMFSGGGRDPFIRDLRCLITDQLAT